MSDDDAWTRQMETLGAIIRQQRQIAELSLRELAVRTRVSNPYLSQIERGLHQPSLKVLSSIAGALGVPTQFLLAQAGLFTPAEGADAAADGPAAAQQQATAPAGPPRRPSTEETIMADERLGAAEKEVLLAVYRSYVERGA